MANFRAYPGRWIEAIEDIQDLKKGGQYQILSSGGGAFMLPIMTFVGMKASFPAKIAGKHVKPINEPESTS